MSDLPEPPEIDLREAAERVAKEILRQHPDTEISGRYALVQSNKALNIADLAKAALGMRVTRWDQD